MKRRRSPKISKNETKFAEMCIALLCVKHAHILKWLDLRDACAFCPSASSGCCSSFLTVSSAKQKRDSTTLRRLVGLLGTLCTLSSLSLTSEKVRAIEERPPSCTATDRVALQVLVRLSQCYNSTAPSPTVVQYTLPTTRRPTSSAPGSTGLSPSSPAAGIVSHPFNSPSPHSIPSQHRRSAKTPLALPACAKRPTPFETSFSTASSDRSRSHWKNCGKRGMRSRHGAIRPTEFGTSARIGRSSASTT